VTNMFHLRAIENFFCIPANDTRYNTRWQFWEDICSIRTPANIAPRWSNLGSNTFTIHI